MRNMLLTYMDERFREKTETTEKKLLGGPVLTISREYGCPTGDITDYLLKALSQTPAPNKKEVKWEVITKEILSESSKKLDMQPEKLEYVFKSEKRTVMDEILAALSSRYYKSDKRIRKTIQDIIRSIANRGNVIIVGRGGVSITHDFPNALHVRLQAPLYWRAHQISEIEKLTYKEAEQRVKEMDEKRKALIDEFLKTPAEQSIFDVVLNTRTMTSMQIAEIIVYIMKIRGFIKT